MNFLFRNADEIASDEALRLYGAALAGLTVVTAVFWLTTEPISLILNPAEPPVCWPIFRDCFKARVFSSAQITIVVLGLLGLGLVNVAMFFGRHVRVAYLGLLITTGLKCAIIVQDYRLIHNQHYMAAWAIGVYLFVPSKRLTLRLLVVSFYFWSGILKLNVDWISGAALYGTRPFGLPDVLIPASCVYVVALELGFVFGVLSRRRGLFWFSMAQLLLFHISSFWVVGWFYPILMFLILSLFFLDRIIEKPVLSRAGGAERPRNAAAVVSLVFAVFQWVPALYPGESALTGQGRMFALHMFDALVECRSVRVFHSTDGTPETVTVRPRFVYRRIACDPLVHYELARDYCRNSVTNADDLDFTLQLESRRHNGEYQRVLDIPTFCASNTQYKWLGPNSWILTDATTLPK